MEKMIGPAARIFRYAEQTQADPSWQAPGFDDSRWSRVTCGFGPKFWKLGSLPDDIDVEALDSRLAVLRQVDPSVPVEIGGQSYRWIPYAFSWRWGAEGDPGHQGYHGLKENVTDDFLCLGKPKGGLNETLYVREDAGGRYYLWTSAAASERGRANVMAGGLQPAAVYLQGHLIEKSEQTIDLVAGDNPLLLRYDKPGRGHFVLEQAGAPESRGRTPLAMSWYDRPGVVPFDIRSGTEQSVGWYRFTAPPGLRAVTIACYGTLQAWAEGLPMHLGGQETLAGGLVQYRAVPTQRVSGMARVALRIEQHRGCYGGSAIPESMQLECGPGLMEAGDWSKDSVLECYSGGAWYRRTVVLTAEQVRGRVVLDLGDVAATAEVRVNGPVAGIRVTPPWMVDVSQHVKPGGNRIEILAYNTLANHYLTIPTHYRGSLRSGLIGPVRLEIQQAAP